MGAERRLFVAPTDNRWFRFLRERKIPEVNFWRPSARGFRILRPGELFLFKLHREHAIAGGGFFVKYTRMPVSLAWQTFEEANGASNPLELLNMIQEHRSDTPPHPDPEIGCIILTEVFYFMEDEKVPLPRSYRPNLQSGRSYSLDTTEGLDLYEAVVERLEARQGEVASIIRETGDPYQVVRRRLRPQGFRILVADAYQRRCAVTGEKVYPVLEAAHIKPVKASGPHEVRNGVFLRADLHKLFDAGYMTLDTDRRGEYRVVVSQRVKEEYDNGKEYLRLHGRPLIVVPSRRDERPAGEYIRWHRENIFIQ